LQASQWGEVEEVLAKLSPTIHMKTFWNWLITALNIAMAYRQDVDAIIMNDRHFKVGPEEPAKES
jgi:hypothetical protein